MRRFWFLALVIAWPAGCAMAQDGGVPDQVYRQVEVKGGTATRIAVLPNLKKDCSNGPLPEFKILRTPSHGKIIARRSRIHTGKDHRCPDTDALAQVLFYQANPNYDGPDEVAIEITSPQGAKAISNAQIMVRGKPKGSGQDI